MSAIQDLFDRNTLRNVQFEFIQLILFKDGDNIEQNLRSLHGLDDDVGLALLQFNRKDVELVLMQDKCLNSSQINSLNDLVVALILNNHLVNLIIILVLHKENINLVFLLVINHQVFIAIL